MIDLTRPVACSLHGPLHLSTKEENLHQCVTLQHILTEMSVNSSQDVEAELIDLYEQLETKDNTISALESRLTKVVAKGGDSQVGEATTAASRFREELNERTAELRQCQLDRDELTNEKLQLKNELDSQTAKIVRLEQNILSARIQSEEQYKVEVESRELRNTIKELESNEQDLIVEVETLASEKANLEHDAIKLKLKLESLVKSSSSYDNDKVELLNQLKDATKKQNQLQNELGQAQEDYENELSHLDVKLRKMRKEKYAAEERMSLSYAAKKQRSLQDELETLRKDIHYQNQQFQRCMADKKRAERELQSNREAFLDAEITHTDEIQDAIEKERLKVKQLSVRLESATKKENDMVALCLDLESERDEAKLRLRNSDERNSWYERRHGLVDAVRYQKKLEAKLHLHDQSAKTFEARIQKEVDNRRCLQNICDIIKEKAGISDNDPIFDKEKVRLAMESHEDQLKSENAELKKQIANLQDNRLSLMKELRHSACHVSEQGIKYLGLDATQMKKLTEFATSLRNDSMVLPQNDKSKELPEKFVSGKAESIEDKLTIKRLDLGETEQKRSRRDQVMATTETMEEIQALHESQKENRGLHETVISLREAAQKALLAQQTAMKDVLPPSVRERGKAIIGEELVDMPSEAQVQMLCLVKAYDIMAKRQQHSSSLADAACNDDGDHDRTVALGAEKWKRRLSLIVFDLSNRSNSRFYRESNKIISDLVDCLDRLAQKDEDVTIVADVLTRYQMHLEEMKLFTSSQTSQACITRKDCVGPRAIDEKNGEKNIFLIRKELTSVKTAAKLRTAQLKSLLSEKNTEIEAYRKKVMKYEDESKKRAFLAASPPKSDQSSDGSFTTVEKFRQVIREVDLCQDCLEPDIGNAAKDKRGNWKLPMNDTKIQLLEIQLRDAEEGRTESEMRCNNALSEMILIKGEMQSLSNRLQGSESQKIRISELESCLKDKDVKLRHLYSKFSHLKLRCAKDNNSMDVSSALEEVAKVKRQLTATRLGKRKSEDELELWRKKMNRAVEDSARAEKEIVRLKRVAIDAKADRDVASSKATRALYKLKDIENREADLRREKERMQEVDKKQSDLMRKNASLRGQLASLKNRSACTSDDSKKEIVDRNMKTHRTKICTCNERKEAQWRRLESQLDERRSECKSLGKEVASLSKARLIEKKLVEELQATLKNLDGKHTQVRQELASLRKGKGTTPEGRSPSMEKSPKTLSNGDTSSNKKEAECHCKDDVARLKQELADLKCKHSIDVCTSSKEEAEEKLRLKGIISQAGRDKEVLSNKIRTALMSEQILQTELVTTKAENDILKQELKSFDLEFFEEIEDLKYKYSEAKNKLSELNEITIEREDCNQ